MTVDWSHFTPWLSLIGGVLIGLAAGMLVLFNGRIAGISGILGGLLRAGSGDRSWRLSFLGGLVASPLLVGMISALPPVQIEAGYTTLLAAGFLVGIGTRYGSGCTSGHGVCGLSRKSSRSLAAVASFMLAGFATVFITRHLLG